MDKQSKADLIRIVEAQKDKLSRYESRLRDVVSAYKSLSKEKEALEASLRALSSYQSQQSNKNDKLKSKASSLPSANEKCGNEDLKRPTEDFKPEEKGSSETSIQQDLENGATKSSSNYELTEHSTPSSEEDSGMEELRLQLATLTNSLSTLSAEKSRMEAGFQADRKKLRQEKEERENLIRDLQLQNNLQEKQYKSDLDALKSKLIVERHEREKEHIDHGAMIMELQKLLTEERNAREHLEASIVSLKSRAVTTDQTEKHLQEAHDELSVIKDKLKESEATAKEAPPILLQLQLEMAQLKQQHTIAIQEEQKRAIKAEERARHLVAVHEKRVASLESRLAELSETVGSYDRLRQSDQLSIQNLKEHISQLSITSNSATDIKTEKDESCVEVDPFLKVQTLLAQLSKLKEDILEANQLSEKPIDVEDAIFSNFKDVVGSCSDLHTSCREEKNRLLQELEQIKNVKSHSSLYQARNREGAEVETLKFQVRSLQERVRMLNCQLEQMESAEQELRTQAHRCQQMETEKSIWQEKIHTLECELRAKAMQTEQQLSLQREHSLALLEDKEQEIRTLKSSFQMFLPHGNPSGTVGNSNANQPGFPECTLEETPSSMDNNLSGGLSGILLSTLHSGSGVPGVGSSESPHILHYAHELARREVDISNLRKARNKLEHDLRDMTKILAAERERHSEDTLRLRESVARLERCQSREGANLEYLKNVVISLLESDSPSSKRHMLNAISAVLRFSEDEMNRVIRHSSNSWWYNSQ